MRVTILLTLVVLIGLGCIVYIEKYHPCQEWKAVTRTRTVYRTAVGTGISSNGGVVTTTMLIPVGQEDVTESECAKRR